MKAGAVSGLFTASSERADANGAWTKAGRTFSPVLNLGSRPVLGAWVYGDGQGELLNIQVRSPLHTTSLGMGDHYMNIDFTGWRYFEMIEPDYDRIANYTWPYAGGGYAVYRENVDFGQVEFLSLWYNQLPTGKKVGCYVSPIKAIPLVKGKVQQPALKIGGKIITFPAAIETGSYLEFRSMTDSKLYGAKGEFLADVTPTGDIPTFASGENPVEFNCDTASENLARVRVTLISRGEPLQE